MIHSPGCNNFFMVNYPVQQRTLALISQSHSVMKGHGWSRGTPSVTLSGPHTLHPHPVTVESEPEGVVSLPGHLQFGWLLRGGLSAD